MSFHPLQARASQQASHQAKGTCLFAEKCLRTADADRKCKSKVGRTADADQKRTSLLIRNGLNQPTLDPQPQMRRIWRRRINLPYPAQKQSPLSSRPLSHSICPISLPLPLHSSSDVCPPLHIHAGRPAGRARSLVRLFAPSLLPPWHTACSLSLGRSFCSLLLVSPSPSSLLPLTTPANAAPTARRRQRGVGSGPRCRTLGSALQRRRRAYLGKIKDGGHDSKHGGGGGQGREGGKWRWAAAAAAPGRTVALRDGRREARREGEKMAAAAAARRHLKNSLLCYAKDNNRYDTQDRLPTGTKREGSNSDDGFICSLARRLDWRGSRATNCLGEGRMNRKCCEWHCVWLKKRRR